jgi:hypothetical protein
MAAVASNSVPFPRVDQRLASSSARRPTASSLYWKVTW